MKTELISIGDELLIGQVVNTNAAWLATQLNNFGFSVSRMLTVPDVKSEIIASLDEALQRNDLVIITGGLGPTNDDITKYTLCEYFHSGLVTHQPSLELLKRFFQNRKIELTELNRKQAEVPGKCIPLLNYWGTAPGMCFEKDGKLIYSFPGVPFEMKSLFETYVVPELKKRGKGQAIVHKTILTQGIGESFLADKIKSWEDSLPSYIHLAYLPQPGIVRLRLTAIGASESELAAEIENLVEKLILLAGEWVYGFDEDTLESVIGELLKSKNKTVATAESCTGGAIAKQITSVSGSSGYFKGGVVAYANEVKTSLLSVNEETLKTYGAVSEQTVTEMALGVKKLLQTDFAVATSGIAGPDGGTEEKPVGTVWIAVASLQGVETKQFAFGDNRERNVQRALISALHLLKKQIEKKY